MSILCAVGLECLWIEAIARNVPLQYVYGSSTSPYPQLYSAFFGPIRRMRSEHGAGSLQKRIVAFDRFFLEYIYPSSEGVDSDEG